MYVRFLGLRNDGQNKIQNILYLYLLIFTISLKAFVLIYRIHCAYNENDSIEWMIQIFQVFNLRSYLEHTF